MATSLFGQGAAVNVNANGTLLTQSFIGTAGQTVFNIVGWTYTPGTNSLIVFINGQRQVPGRDFSETTNSSFTLLEGVVLGDFVDIIGFPETTLDSTTAGAVLIGSGYSVAQYLADSPINANAYPYLVPRDGTTEASISMQLAINAGIAQNRKVIFGPGRYKCSVPLNVLGQVVIDFSNREALILMATQNMNGIVIGDGTAPTRSLLFGTQLLQPAFAPFPGVAQSVSGSCIFENYCAVVDVIEPSFYGLDAAVRKLFNGLTQFQCIQCDTPYILSQEMHGDAIVTSGGAGILRTVDCNYDNARIINSDGNGVTWGAFSEGVGMYRPEMYGLTGWCVRIIAGAGLNFFLTDPDFELTAASAGGILASTGSGLMIADGWSGSNGALVTLPIAVQVDAGFNSAVIAFSQTYAVRFILNGGACKIAQGIYTSDTVTAGTGILLGATDCEVASGVTIRQYPGTGIGFTGTPTGIVIGNVKFKSCGTDIASVAAWAALAGPIIGNIQTDKARTGYAAGATVNIPNTVSFAQINGVANISTIPPSGVGSMMTIQANGSINNYIVGGNLAFRAMPVAVPNFQAIHMRCDGVNWFEVGRTF